MLLGDGSPTRHLRLLTGHPVAVRLVAMEAEPEPQGQTPSQLPREVRELEPLLLRRQGGSTVAARPWPGRKAGGTKPKPSSTYGIATCPSGSASPKDGLNCSAKWMAWLW